MTSFRMPGYVVEIRSAVSIEDEKSCAAEAERLVETVYRARRRSRDDRNPIRGVNAWVVIARSTDAPKRRIIEVVVEDSFLEETWTGATRGEA